MLRRMLTKALFILILAGFSLVSTAACPEFTGEGSAQVALLRLEQSCLGKSEDVVITKTVKARLDSISARDIPLRSSEDVRVHRHRTAQLLNEIAGSLASVPRDARFASIFTGVQAELARDTAKVWEGQVHEATGWRHDQLVLHGGFDLATPLDEACQTSKPSCLYAFRQASELLRHSNLTHDVLFISNQHLPELTRTYKELDRQWDYYFGKARSQYVWELGLNSYLYEKGLLKECRSKTDNTLQGDELETFCKNRNDIRLSAPPKGQWILFHPTVALEYVNTDQFGNSANRAVAVIEVVGYNKFATKDAFPIKLPIGASIITTISLDGYGDRFGYGAMMHFRNNLSIGVAKRDFDDDSETTWLITADLGKLLADKKKAVKEKFKFID